MSEEMWMGRTPAQLHVESFYDDPYACEEDCNPDSNSAVMGRFCRWLHQFGQAVLRLEMVSGILLPVLV